MNERIVLLRKRLGKNQEEFAEILNLSRSFINLCENGKRNFSDRTIADICEKFNVNEEWIRTGTGEMFREVTANEQIAAFVGDLFKEEQDSFKQRLVGLLASLDEAEWKMLEKFVDKLQKKS